MAKTHQRALALILAVMFLATSVVTGVMVIMQIQKDNKEAAKLESSTDSGSSGSESLEIKDQSSEENKLQGTKLENFKPVEKVEKLEVVDLKEGDGEEVKEGASVVAHYTGALANDGTIFQSSKDIGEPADFRLDRVIKGWTEGVPGMKVGGIRRLIIPAEMAYGANPPQGSGIPANAPLVFDIELTQVKNP